VLHGVAVGLIGDPRVEHHHTLPTFGRGGYRVGGRAVTNRFLTREELAEMTGLHRDHIGRLERNEVEDSRLPTIRKLAEALGVDPHELVKPEE
jgi:DNA-binding Xre family transcriptional regulator